jgi:uncharacterized membrane protein YdjX (TVP38/TMEM64 family)
MKGPLYDISVLIGLSLLAALLVYLFREQANAAINLMGTYSGTPMAIGVAVLVFFIGSIFFVPQCALIAAASAAFGLVDGSVIAWFATMVSVTAHVFAARALAGRFEERLHIQRLDYLRTLFKRNSVQSGFLVRLIPTGPAILVNVAAGLFGVSRGGFLLGSALGVIPKILLTGIVASELISSAQGKQFSLWLAVGAVGLIALSLMTRKARPPRQKISSK